MDGATPRPLGPPGGRGVRLFAVTPAAPLAFLDASMVGCPWSTTGRTALFLLILQPHLSFASLVVCPSGAGLVAAADGGCVEVGRGWGGCAGGGEVGRHFVVNVGELIIMSVYILIM